MKGGGFYNVLVQIDNIHHDYDHSSLFANCKVGLCQIASAGKGKVWYSNGKMDLVGSKRRIGIP